MNAPAHQTAVGEINTLLGSGSEFDGKLTFEGTVRIDGTLRGEVFSDDVLVVGEGAVVEADVDIGENCRVRRAIIDRGTVLEAGTVIGEDPDADRERGFRITQNGVTLVTPDMLGQHLHFTR